MGPQSTATKVPETSSDTPAVSRGYAWLVFTLSFGLLLSDYMSRQVLNAVFPQLKAEWLLSDSQLGSLSGIVALMVGVLTFPLSLLADRWGRAKSLVIAAGVWSLATLGCAASASYGQMFMGRFLVGVGEAAYGSVGIAVVLSVFPVRLRATLSGAFIAGGSFGSVLGVSVGGVIGQAYGWRWAFGVMGAFGLVLAAVFGFVVTDKKLGSAASKHSRQSGERASLGPQLRRLFSSVSVICAYIGSGAQMFITAAMLAWMPSFLNRYYDLPTGKAGLAAGGFALISGTGMILCGVVADRLSKRAGIRKWTVAIACSLGSLVLLPTGFQLPTGPAQLIVIAAGTLVVGGASGPAAAMVARLTPAGIAATAMATLTLANSLIGIAPGPAATGVLADRWGLLGALQVVPLTALAGSVAFAIGKSFYEKDLRRMGLLPDPAFPNPEYSS
ncbi:MULTISPECIES: MFS transporter [Streptomyces]|uniref:MFS transporter n=1 Tax=Streptomyces lycopersici TaxID=2974589 RepID=UPI0021D0AC00|nr:MFS transporter [Streptomyces sp. NEAU-383]